MSKFGNNIYDEIFIDKRMHTNDRRGVRFGSVDCVNINSNNIYSNTRKNVTFNTKIYDDQDYFYNLINPTVENTYETADAIIDAVKNANNRHNVWIFSEKDNLTDFTYNKNKDHFFAGTQIIFTRIYNNGGFNFESRTVINRCNPYKLRYAGFIDSRVFEKYSHVYEVYEKNKPLTFNYGPIITSLPSTDRHMCYGIYANIFNANNPDSFYEDGETNDNCCNLDECTSWKYANSGGEMENAIPRETLEPMPFKNIQMRNASEKTFLKRHYFHNDTTYNDGMVGYGALTEWMWHNKHQSMLNEQIMTTGDPHACFERIKATKFITKWESVKSNKAKPFYGINCNKKIINLFDNSQFFKCGSDSSINVVTFSEQFSETRHRLCGEIREDRATWIDPSTDNYGNPTGGHWSNGWYRYNTKCYTYDKYNLLFPFGFYLSNNPNSNQVIGFLVNELTNCISKYGIANLKKHNTLQYLSIDDQNMNVEMNKTLTVDYSSLSGSWADGSATRIGNLSIPD